MDNQGGFHGDGDIVMVIGLTSKENDIFLNTIDKNWMSIDDDNDIMNILWGLDTLSDDIAAGEMLNNKIKPESDIKYKLFDINSKKLNSEIDVEELYDFYFVGYSKNKGKIYIQNSLF